MAWRFWRRSAPEQIAPAAAVERVVQRLRNDSTEARFEVLATEGDLRRSEQAAADSPTDGSDQQLVALRERVTALRDSLSRLEAKVAEAAALARSLVARASSARSRLVLTQLMADAERGDAAQVFDELQQAARQIESEAEAAEEVENLG